MGMTQMNAQIAQQVILYSQVLNIGAIYAVEK